jgi:hypothetical protein
MWAFDLDGVVADSYPPMMERVGDFLNCDWSNDKPMPYDPHKFGYEITSGKILEFFCELVMEDKVTPMAGAFETLKDYYDKTQRVVFITHRHDPKVVVKTREWLSKNLGLPYELYACHHCEKVFLAKDIGITGFVDDLPAICQGFVQEGLDSLCYTAPWHCYVSDTLDGLKVVNNWQEIREVIL